MNGWHFESRCSCFWARDFQRSLAAQAMIYKALSPRPVCRYNALGVIGRQFDSKTVSLEAEEGRLPTALNRTHCRNG